MKKFLSFLSVFFLFYFIFFIFRNDINAIIPSGVRPFPLIPYVMTDCYNGDWQNPNYRQETSHGLDVGHPEWGPVGGWWDFSGGRGCLEGGSTPEKYILKAQGIKVKLDDNTIIPKPVGVGIIFNNQSDIDRYSFLNDEKRFPNLAFIVAAAPVPENSGTFEKVIDGPGEGNCHYIHYLDYGEITSGYCNPANAWGAGCDNPNVTCVSGQIGWAKKMIVPIANAFPKIPVFFQISASTIGELLEIAQTNNLKNAAFKNNGWIHDPGNAVITRDGVVAGGMFGLYDYYYDKTILGFEPGGGFDAYWMIVEALSHHPDFFDIQRPMLSKIVDVKTNYQFDSMKFLRDYSGKSLENSPGFWTILRTTTQGEDTCWTGSADKVRVCSGPWRKNFSYWLYQKDDLPGGRSVVFAAKSSLVPSAAQNHIYGAHTVRRTDQANGQNFMYFDIDDNYRQPSNKQGWEIIVTFVNKGNDKLSLEYKNKSNQTIKKSINKGSVLGTVDNWIDYKWTLSDADFVGNKMNGADFRINCEGDGDEIIHRVIVKPVSLPATPTPRKPTLSPAPNPTSQPTISSQPAYFPGWQKINFSLDTKIPQNCRMITFKEEGFWENFLSFLNNLSFAPKKRQVWLKCE